MTQQHQYIAKTFKGMEECLAEEMKEKQLNVSEIAYRAVHFSGDLADLYKAVFTLQTAVRILVPLHNFRFRNEHDFYKAVYQIPWETMFSNKKSILINGTVHSKIFNHSNYGVLKCKDAIVDRFRDKTGDRPNIARDGANVFVDLRVEENEAWLSLDAGGEALFKRGYRQERVEAPMNEVLAAGLLRMAGYDGTQNFYDPMCGSGTLITEAAYIAANAPVQLERKNFAFTHWNNYDQKAWEKLLEKEVAKIRPISVEIGGSDVNMKAIAASRKNISNLRFDHQIKVFKVDIKDLKPKSEDGICIMNPPYNERMYMDSYAFIGDALKQNWSGWSAWIISSELDLLKTVGLKTSKRIPLKNGQLDCSFRNYQIFDDPKDA